MQHSTTGRFIIGFLILALLPGCDASEVTTSEKTNSPDILSALTRDTLFQRTHCLIPRTPNPKKSSCRERENKACTEWLLFEAAGTFQRNFCIGMWAPRPHLISNGKFSLDGEILTLQLPDTITVKDGEHLISFPGGKTDYLLSLPQSGMITLTRLPSLNSKNKELSHSVFTHSSLEVPDNYQPDLEKILEGIDGR